MENLFEETIVENLSDLRKKIDIQIQEAQTTLNKMNLRRPIPIKMAKVIIDNFKSSNSRGTWVAQLSAGLLVSVQIMISWVVRSSPGWGSALNEESA